MSEPLQLVANDATAHWEARIRTAWQHTVENIFHTGREISGAKEDSLCRFEDMILPFSRAMASMLMAIAQDQRLGTLYHGKLPAHWRTLYSLTLLDGPTFEAHQSDITPELERATVEVWRKQQRRAQRERDLAERTKLAATELGAKLYGVIYADPPWRFEPYSRTTGLDRSADNHYPTMTVEDILAINIPAATDCALFLWATAPMLEQALLVMERWGFDYKSNFVWVKKNPGTGYWNRNRHELLLVGTRGDIPAPAPGEQYESVIEASAPRLEMFARSRYAGWDSWGNEVTP